MTFSHFTALANGIDRLNTAVGRAASWCALAIVLLGFAIVLLRYVLGAGSIWLQESILYAHSALFLLAAAWTLKEGGHVRVDVFYADAAPRTKAWIDLLGAVLLLLPFCVAIVYFSAPYVARSFAILERSRETSGLPLVFLLKTLIPVFALMLGLQGVAQMIRAAAVLIPPLKGEGPPRSGGGGVSVGRFNPHPVRFADHPSVHSPSKTGVNALLPGGGIGCLKSSRS